jgi:hypothetical protein
MLGQQLLQERNGPFVWPVAKLQQGLESGGIVSPDLLEESVRVGLLF